MEKEVNTYLSLNEKLAFINGYLNSIAILNSTADNAMEHWIINLGVIEDDLVHTIKKGINPTWTFRATEIADWQKVTEDECCCFFSNILDEIRGKVNHHLDRKDYFAYLEKYNLTAQLKYFIKMIEELLSSCQLKTAYSIKIDWGDERYSTGPYFAYHEYNLAFELKSTQVLFLHFGVSD